MFVCAVGAEGKSDEDIITLGVQGHAFKFAKDSPCDISCVLCSATESADVQTFIEDCLPEQSPK